MGPLAIPAMIIGGLTAGGTLGAAALASRKSAVEKEQEKTQLTSMEEQLKLAKAQESRSAEQFSSGWVPAAYICEDALPHAICLALLKAAGVFEPGIGAKETA